MIAESRIRVCCLAIFAATILAGANIAMAHHSFAMFDTTEWFRHRI